MSLAHRLTRGMSTPLWILGMTAALVACANPDAGQPHPPNELDYPVSVTADPDGRHLWVSSGNFDLAWRGGAIMAVDLQTHTFVADRTATDDGLPGMAQIGGFPGPIHLLERDGKAVAAYVLSRAENSLYYLPITHDNGVPRLSCEGSTVQDNGVIACGSGEAFSSGTFGVDGKAVEGNLGEDPFGALIHHGDGDGEDQDLLLTGAMLEGELAVFGLDSLGTPRLLSQTNLSDGLFAFAESPTTRHIFTSHKFVNVINVLEVVPAPADEANPTLPETPTLKLVKSLIIPATIVQDYSRSMAVSSDGSRLYAAYRSPSSVLIIDIAAGAEATPDERLLAKIPMSASPGDIVVVPASESRDSELVYVSGYNGDRIDVIDPALGVVVDTIRTGHGPYGMAHVSNPELGIDRLYVAIFHNQSVGVVELDPTSPYHHTVVAEIR